MGSRESVQAASAACSALSSVPYVSGQQLGIFCLPARIQCHGGNPVSKNNLVWLLPLAEIIRTSGTSQVVLVVKNPLANAEDVGLIPGLGRSPGGGNGNPLQYPVWEIPWTEEPGRLQSMASQSRTRLKQLSTRTCIRTCDISWFICCPEISSRNQSCPEIYSSSQNHQFWKS